MKMQTGKFIQTRRIRSFMVLSAVNFALLFSGTSNAYDKYQYTVLFDPTEDMLEAEERGRIMIYDGLENKVVEQAMTEQFDRIENMMFVRTRHIQDDGELLVEEDGCD